jgi:hypothetical protein
VPEPRPTDPIQPPENSPQRILARAEGPNVPAGGENSSVDSERHSVDLSRLAWLITVLVLAVTDLILFVKGYYGYFGATLAVAISAAINLF